MAAPSQPGKTAPRFVRDLLVYDPSNPPRSRFNLLTDAVPIFHDFSSFPQLLSRRSCEHRYIIKRDHTRLPPEEDVALPPSTVCRVSAVCLNCRHHLELGLSYKNHKKGDSGHLHHLVHSPHLANVENPRNPFASKGQQLESYYFECSYPTCSAIVMAKFLSPLFSPHFVDVLTDEQLLKKRATEALEAEPERLEGLGQPLPITVLSNLRTYIGNSLHHPEKNKAITSNNKRFMTCFGVGGRPCQELLEFLEFKPNDDQSAWIPPQPNATTAPYHKEVLTVFLDNASHELTCLINQRPHLEKTRHSEEINFQPADHFFGQLMGALKYEKVPHLSRTLPMSQTPPYYEALGATEDMSNDLIIEAYNRQMTTDPDRSTYYLRCLQSIGAWRGDTGGVSIAQAVSYEYNIGRYADNDIPEAFNYFNLDYRNENLSEDAIIGSFYARVGDSAYDMEPRRQLWRIGDTLGSEKVKAVAEERISTAEQALVFLGGDKDTPDDFIISMYAAKVSDTPASKELARHAVGLIADERKSQALSHFLQTGEMEAKEMDVGQAFQLLQIPDRTADDAAILAAFSVCCSDAPAQIDTYRKALSIIASEKQSPVLGNVIAEAPALPPRAAADWPVGLNNIGNTCYLNSLLQFYFTVKPFRNMVLHVEDYKAELDEESVRNKRVGSRKVSLAEIERSQRFLQELRLLFQNMISSSNPAVTPGQELARLTLLSSTGEAAIRRKSLAHASHSVLGEINGLPIQGPLGPPTTDIDNDHQSTADTKPSKEPEAVDTDSQDTFVSAPTPPSSDQDTQMDDTEKTRQESDKVEDGMDYAADDTQPGLNSVPTPPNDPSTGAPTPPDRPPPVPPRPARQVDNEQLIKEEVELGAQQDVTEVINNVLFQAQCAIRPLKLDADGEPVDVITDLFYGKTKSYITAEKGTRSKDELWADIKVDVATGSRDIYAAIDGAFDVQRVHVDEADAEQHGAIKKLPPVLQIQVQRVQFDQVKKTSFKSTHHLELKETIYLDRYMDTPHTDDDLNCRRREKWKWKDELRALEARKADFVDDETWELLPDVLRKTRERLQSLKSVEEMEELTGSAIDVDDGVINDLERLEDMTRNEIKDIESRERELQTFIDTQFADLRNIPYHLYAVFMHHGSVSFGHYYIYIYDFARNIWRKYNDNYVTEVHDTTEIFGGGSQDQRNPPTPYFVVYVHDRMRERVAEPVCRQVAEQPDQPQHQPAMPTAPPTPPPRPSATRIHSAKEVEMAEVNHTSGVNPGHESRRSSPGMHNHNYHVDVAGTRRASAAAATGTSWSTGTADWNSRVADHQDVAW